VTAVTDLVSESVHSVTAARQMGTNDGLMAMIASALSRNGLVAVIGSGATGAGLGRSSNRQTDRLCEPDSNRGRS
jgi:hypothetical protein